MKTDKVECEKDERQTRILSACETREALNMMKTNDKQRILSACETREALNMMKTNGKQRILNACSTPLEHFPKTGSHLQDKCYNKKS